ncbi:hypothetical protein BDV26DRAFT_264374 [Aspergillus bertholletiae]|uniref:F-box domain-containing protein n=1 Tax=Aspergillus bertholletiae TaxID=1226010 RepID=A0A5N7B4N1_9EURO|nr:hypothetical protein BDV26DRAFT_264374 [Aspergillus bertholletiae]
MLLRLPIELRLKVYALVLGACPCRNPHAFYAHQHRIALNILLVNRQIYTETRILGFRLHRFGFHRWCGTGVHVCRIFLQRLRRWQLCSMQKLSLRAVESCLVNGYGSDQSNSEWFDICTMLAAAVESNCVGVRELSLTIEGHLTDGGLKLLDTDAEWVQLGLGSLKCLRRLELVIASDTIQTGVAETFKSSLIDAFSGIQVAMKVVMGGKEISL